MPVELELRTPRIRAPRRFQIIYLGAKFQILQVASLAELRIWP